MSLTTTAINAARPQARPYKLFDESGLYMSVEPSGGKLWRLKYRYGGKEKKLALGAYPDTGLKEARNRRDAARKLLGDGVDPGAQKKVDKLAKALSAANTFQAIADEYIAKKEREGLAQVTLEKARWLLKLLALKIGSRPISEISVPELLAALRTVEQRGNLETARRMRSFAGRVFRYAIATGRAERDLSSDIRGALTAPTVTHRAAILDPVAVGALLRAIDDYGGQPSTALALRLAPHVFVRPGELRLAEWNEIDFDKAVWVIPGRKTKMRKDHQVPLSRQSLAILKLAQKVSGGRRHVFPSTSSTKRPISENTLNGALRRMGFDKDKMSAHGFRAMASSLLNESGKWQPDAIERALAHGEDNAVRGAYNRGHYWDERVRMAQWWSNHLDFLRTGRGRK
ncbi:MAG TPA: integrase arm-type DNA-binding domain-containing protein [Rhizomicrobium sp.]|nr:integrase arm-type DNA-binding domain-containing protein [Rhizomicrobium sp.]